MAQATSALWKALWRAPGTAREYQFDIAGKIYGPDVEVTHSVDSGLYEQFGIGNAATAKLTLSLFAESVPKGAVIKRYIRLRNGERVSEWLPKGVFFINRRGEEDGYWTIEAFDAMRRAEQSWEPDQSLEFPLPMPEAVAEFARIMEVEIDPRTRLNPAYAIDYPASDPESESGDRRRSRRKLDHHRGGEIAAGPAAVHPAGDKPPCHRARRRHHAGGCKTPCLTSFSWAWT